MGAYNNIINNWNEQKSSANAFNLSLHLTFKLRLIIEERKIQRFIVESHQRSFT